MLINEVNIETIKFCTSPGIRKPIDTIHVADDKTIATNGTVLVEVSTPLSETNYPNCEKIKPTEDAIVRCNFNPNILYEVI